MAYTPISNHAGLLPLASAILSTDYRYNGAIPLGTVITAVDPTYGAGEFILLKGVASTAVGSVVVYDNNFQTALASIALDTPRPLAVAMSACVANQYGWYQIGGLAIMKKSAAVSFASGANLGATSGLAVAAATGLRMQGALVAQVASAKSDVTTVQVMIDRPCGPSDLS